MNRQEVEIRQRISSLVESVKGDKTRSNEFFGYVWTMMCVERGLMRIVDEVPSSDATQLLVEEVRTGQHRLVSRPRELDGDLEGLAVQALSRIIRSTRAAG